MLLDRIASRPFPVLVLLILALAPAAPRPAQGQAPSSVPAELRGRWEPVAAKNAPTARHENAFVELGGKFYLLGGRGDRPVDIYDPESRTWTAGARPPFQLHHFQAVAHDGLIYVIGAFTEGFPRERGIDAVLIYDPARDAWRQGPEIPAARRRGAAGAVVYRDKIYIAGGLVGGHGPHATSVEWLDEFDPKTGRWRTLPSAPRVRDHFSAAVVGDRLYLVGGRNTGVEGFIDSTTAAVDVYDFARGAWTTLEASPLPTERAGSSTVAYGKYVVITGGEGFGQTWGQTEALDTETGRWHALGMLNQPRHGTQLIVYRGRLYVAAGAGAQGGGPELTDIEAFVFE